MAKRQTNKKDSIKKSEPKIKEKKPELVERINGLLLKNENLKSEKEELQKSASTEITALEASRENVRQESVKKEESLKKETDRTGIRVAISALVIVLVSICSLFLIAFSQTQSPILNIFIASGLIYLISMIIVLWANDTFCPNENLFVLSIIGGIILGFFGDAGIKSLYSNNCWLFFIASIVLSVILFVSIAYASYKKTENKLSCLRAILLSSIFFVICIIGIVPLSRYHNINQIEHDKKIVEMLKITAEPNGIEILLSAEHASEHGYMKQVLCFKWPEQELAEAEQTQTWKKISDKCTKGEKVWYEAKLDFPARISAIEASGTTLSLYDRKYFPKKEVILFFKHYWEDYEITKKIPLPDPNSG